MAGPDGEKAPASGTDKKVEDKAVKHPESTSVMQRAANALRAELDSLRSGATHPGGYPALLTPELQKILDGIELVMGEMSHLELVSIRTKSLPRAPGRGDVVGTNEQVPPMPEYPGEMTTQIPIVRDRLKKAGINPDKLNGIKIAVIDNHEGKKDEHNHGAQVTSVIQDGKYGLIHDAVVIPIETRDNSLGASDYLNKPGGLGQAVSDISCTLIEDTTKDLREQCLDKRDPALRVVNISQGYSNIKMSEHIFGSMVKDPEKFRPWLNQLLGEEKANEWIASIKKNPEPNEQTDILDKPLWQAIVNFVDSKLAQDPRFKAAQEEYRRTTEQIAKQGIVLVVAAGNAQDDLTKFKLNLKPGAAYNWYAQSNHVIAVGGCDLNRTPGDRSDDQVTEFTSHGNGTFHPTVVAQGAKVPSQWLGISGTSFATPLVAATVGLMLAQNPNLTFSDVKNMLEQNSIRLQGAGPEAQGAGELNIEQAVIAAARSVKK